MADSSGVNATTGHILSDWGHVVQSINKILTTPIGSRVMRREFGSRLFDLIDRKMTDRNVLALYSETALAIHRWEPRFVMTRASLSELSVHGQVGLNIFGVYYPKGHKGDYSIAQDQSVRIVLKGTGKL